MIDQTNGHAANAESNYRQALSIDGDFQPAIWNLALVRGAAGAPQEAIALWRHYLALANSAGAHYNLALQLRAIGDTAEGEAEMTTAIRLDPSFKDPAVRATP